MRTAEGQADFSERAERPEKTYLAQSEAVGGSVQTFAPIRSGQGHAFVPTLRGPVIGSIRPTTPCVQGVGSRTWGGYLLQWVKGKPAPVGVHRIAYEKAYGPIPQGMTIDHLCLNKECVEPTHLELVSQRTNILRANGTGGQNARKTHCKRDHPFDTENTRITRDLKRQCRTCLRTYHARNRERRLAYIRAYRARRKLARAA